jgi:hypothetical protein
MKVRHKHNKKRNTAFLFESLIRELTKTTLNKDYNRKKQIISILKEHFNTNNTLGKELALYKVLYEEKGLSKEFSEKVLSEAKRKYTSLDKKKIFNEQTKVVNKINKTLGQSVYNSFLSKYTQLATIYQMFNDNSDPKNQVLLENKVINDMSSSPAVINEMKPLDTLTFKTFFEKFNKAYSGDLLTEQKQLLSYYVTSFDDNGLEFKIYLNEEIGRLRNILLESTEFKNLQLKDKRDRVLEVLDSYSKNKFDSSMVRQILQIQELIHEITNNGS